MTDRELTLALAVLAQPTRFRIMRTMLETEARGGLHAGEVAERIGRSHSGTAVHLKELERAGLLVSANNGHATFFLPEPAALRTLTASLAMALVTGPDSVSG